MKKFIFGRNKKKLEKKKKNFINFLKNEKVQTKKEFTD